MYKIFRYILFVSLWCNDFPLRSDGGVDNQLFAAAAFAGTALLTVAAQRSYKKQLREVQDDVSAPTMYDDTYKCQRSFSSQEYIDTMQQEKFQLYMDEKLRIKNHIPFFHCPKRQVPQKDRQSLFIGKAFRAWIWSSENNASKPRVFFSQVEDMIAREQEDLNGNLSAMHDTFGLSYGDSVLIRDREDILQEDSPEGHALRLAEQQTIKENEAKFAQHKIQHKIQQQEQEAAAHGRKLMSGRPVSDSQTPFFNWLSVFFGW